MGRLKALETYFVFMLIQFLRNIPKELEEAAKIDGCNEIQTLIKVIVPMLKPALVSCALFKFMWASNDFLGPLLYVNNPAKYPATIFVKLGLGCRICMEQETFNITYFNFTFNNYILYSTESVCRGNICRWSKGLIC